MTLRIEEHPVLPPLARRSVSFTFEGREVDAYEGETIAAALHAAGVRVLARSFKHHRPRGLYCVGGYCPSCAVRVDGLPGVTACITPVRGGEVVTREHAWPSADRDALALLGRLAPLAPVGFQYRRFVRSPALFHRWERLLARLAGMAAPPAAEAARAARAAVAESGERDVVVVGGGPAGLAAAIAAREAGARVTLLEQEPELGGSLLAETGLVDGERGFELARRLAGDAAAAGVDVVAGASAFGWYDEGCLAVAAPGRLLVLRPRALVLATGSYALSLPFENGDLPGVLLGAGVRRLLHRDRVRPGHRAVVLGAGAAGQALEGDLVAAGVSVCAVADLNEISRLRARGRGRVAALDFSIGGRRISVGCDSVCVAAGRRPALELLLQRTSGGAHLLDSPHAALEPAPAPPTAAADRTWVAGSAAGAACAAESLAQGRAAGLTAAASLGE